MNVLHVCRFSPHRISGPAQSVVNLATAQLGIPSVRSVRILNLGHLSVPREAGTEYADLYVTPNTGLLDRDRLLRSVDMVHFHGVYNPHYPALGRRCRRLGIPYVISPRSSLMRAAMATSWLKKRVFNTLFFDRFVKGASARHFLTSDEAANSRFGHLPHFVVTNGIAIPPNYEPNTLHPFLFTFIGRLDVRHKGLDILLYGLHRARAALRTAGANVCLYGPDQRGGLKTLRALVRQLDLQEVVSLRGRVQGENKARALADATVFVHASRYEGQPQAVLEAWAHGRPSLVTPGTNLTTDVVQHRTGWAVEGTPEGIANGIRSLLSAPDAVVDRGNRARQFAESHLSLQSSAQAVVAAYHEIATAAVARAA